MKCFVGMVIKMCGKTFFKRLIQSLMLSLGMCASNASFAACAIDYYDVSAYIGVDYYQAFMKSTAFWNQLFPSNFPGANFYLGTQFHENFAIEVGYLWSVRQNKDWTLTQGQQFFNSSVNANFSGKTHLQRTGAYIDLIGILPVAECTDLMGFIGTGWDQPKIEIRNLNVNPGAAIPNSSAIAAVSGKGRGVFRLAVGLRYLLTDIIGLRFKLGWESTTTLHVSGNGNPYFLQFGYNQRAFKGSTTLSAGAFIMF